MKLSLAATLLATIASVNAIPSPHLKPRAIDISDLVPEFGVIAGTDANVLQQGSCSGFNGQKEIPIPCTCPPDREEFISKLKIALLAGNVFGDAISFSSDAADQSFEANRDRATACVILLQSFNGKKGDGCPGASAPNFISQQITGIRSDHIAVG